MLFATALTYKSVCKIYLIVSDSGKGKDIVAVLLDFLCNHFHDPGALYDLICSDGPSSEFNNKVMVKFPQSFSLTEKRLFFWKSLLKAMGKKLLMELMAKLSLRFDQKAAESSRAATKQTEVIHI